MEGVRLLKSTLQQRKKATKLDLKHLNWSGKVHLHVVYLQPTYKEEWTYPSLRS